jgi:hypothetical protein
LRPARCQMLSARRFLTSLAVRTRPAKRPGKAGSRQLRAASRIARNRARQPPCADWRS